MRCVCCAPSQVTLGERRWRAILRDVRGMAALKVYMDGHDGALPPVMAPTRSSLSFVDRLRAAVCGQEDPNIRYRILLSKQRWRDEGVEDKKAYVGALMPGLGKGGMFVV